MFEVGQAVVCVDLTQPVNTAFPPVETVLKMRGIYRVDKVCPTKLGQIIGIVGISPWLWEQWRFRPLTAADATFTASIKACRPAHRPVSA